jgi:hypothetical protein
MRNAVIFCLLATIAVSAQNKQRVAVLPSVGDLDPQRLILLTDKVREIATKHLPMEDFNVLKQDVITKMIGEEELYRSCKEGVCIGDLAKKTNANYGARCDVVRLDDGLVLKFEMYSVNEEAIFETFTDYDVKDFRGMLAVLEARLPATFQKMMNASKSREAAVSAGLPAPPAPPLLPPEVAVVPLPPPAEITPYAAQQAKPRKLSPVMLTLRVSGAVVAAGGFAGGLLVNGAVKDAFDKYSNYGPEGNPRVTDAENPAKVEKMREDIDSNISMRNTLYVLASLGLCGFAVTLFF